MQRVRDISLYLVQTALGGIIIIPIHSLFFLKISSHHSWMVAIATPTIVEPRASLPTVLGCFYLHFDLCFGHSSIFCSWAIGRKRCCTCWWCVVTCPATAAQVALLSCMGRSRCAVNQACWYSWPCFLTSDFILVGSQKVNKTNLGFNLQRYKLCLCSFFNFIKSKQILMNVASLLIFG